MHASDWGWGSLLEDTASFWLRVRIMLKHSWRSPNNLFRLLLFVRLLLSCLHQSLNAHLWHIWVSQVWTLGLRDAFMTHLKRITSLLRYATSPIPTSPARASSLCCSTFLLVPCTTLLLSWCRTEIVEMTCTYRYFWQPLDRNALLKSFSHCKRALDGARNAGSPDPFLSSQDLSLLAALFP